MNLLLSLLFLTATPNDVDDVMERWEGLVDVDVYAADCGEENAWFQPADNAIVMCNELRRDPELYRWVLAHELGHAFMWQHEVPVRWGTKDQERVADELAFFMSTDEETQAAARWFMSHAERKQRAGDPHPAALDRAAALVCLSAGRANEDRMCHAFYDSALAHWVRIFDGYLP
jgi:Zn-dependent peptidase ImmA (M78 family)